jgi:hypothetical protein
MTTAGGATGQSNSIGGVAANSSSGGASAAATTALISVKGAITATAESDAGTCLDRGQ